MEPLLIGVDVGGTTIRMGSVTPDGRILMKIEYPTDVSRGGLVMMENLPQRFKILSGEEPEAIVQRSEWELALQGPSI